MKNNQNTINEVEEHITTVLVMLSLVCSVVSSYQVYAELKKRFPDSWGYLVRRYGLAGKHGRHYTAISRINHFLSKSTLTEKLGLFDSPYPQSGSKLIAYHSFKVKVS